MVDTIKITALPTELSPTSNDVVPMVDIETATTKQVSFDEFGKAINYSNSISTDAENLLAVDGSNKLLLGAANEIISTDASNTLSVGSDGKVYGSATALSLNENEFFVGNASNQPVSTPSNTVRGVLGLPTDYKKVSVVRDSGTQVTVSGSVRSEQDDIDLSISISPVTLSGASATTKYNLFLAKVNDTSPTVAFFDSASIPAGYAHYRIIATIPTDSLSNLANFTNDGNEIELWGGDTTSGTLNLAEDYNNFRYLSFYGKESSGGFDYPGELILVSNITGIQTRLIQTEAFFMGATFTNSTTITIGTVTGGIRITSVKGVR